MHKRPAEALIDPRNAKRPALAVGFSSELPASNVRTNYWPVEILTDKIFKYHYEFLDGRIIEEPAKLRKILRCTFDYMQMPKGTSRFVWGNSLFTLVPLPLNYLKTPIELTEDKVNEIPACSIIILGPDAFDFNSNIKGMQRAHRHAGNQEYEMVSRKEGSFICQIINILFKPIITKGMGLTPMGRRGYFNVSAGEGNDRNVLFMPGFNPVVVLHNNRLFLHTDFQYRAVARDNALRHVYNTDPKLMKGQSVFCEHNKRHYIVSDVRRDMTPSSTFELKGGSSQTYADYYQSRYGLRVRDFKQPMLEVTQRSKEGVKSIYLVPEFCKIAGIPKDQLKNTRLPTTSTVERHQKLSHFIASFAASAAKTQFSTVKLDQQFYDPGASLLRAQSIKFLGAPFRMSGGKTTWDDKLRTDSNNKMLDVQRFNWTVWVTDRSLETDARNFYDTFVKVMRPLCQNGLEQPNWVTDDYRNISKVATATPRPAVVLIVLGTVDAVIYNSVKRDLLSAGIPGQIVVREKFMKGRQADMSKVTKAGLQLLTKAGGILWTTAFEPNDPLGNKLSALHTCVFGIERSIGRSTGATTKIAVTCTVDQDPSRFSEYFNYHAAEAAHSMPSLQSIVERGLAAFKTKNQKLPGRLVFYSSGASEGSLKAVLANDVKEVKSAIAELYKGQSQPEMLYVLMCRSGTTRLFAEEKGYVTNVKPGTLVEKNICANNEFYLVSHDAGQKSVLPPKYILAHHDEPEDKQKVTFTMKDLQRLSFGLCHVYYNWPGPISCPAPLKYADKLAKLASAALLPSRTDNALATKLFYI